MYEWGLIDLKRLIEDVEYWEEHDDPKQPDYDTRDIEGVINSQPVVDVIPIEWIKDYVDFGVSDELAQRNRRFVLNMIKDWEKEKRGGGKNERGL